MRRILDVDIPGKRRRGRSNIRWKDAYKIDMTEPGLKEDNATNTLRMEEEDIQLFRQHSVDGTRQ